MKRAANLAENRVDFSSKLATRVGADYKLYWHKKCVLIFSTRDEQLCDTCHMSNFMLFNFPSFIQRNTRLLCNTILFFFFLFSSAGHATGNLTMSATYADVGAVTTTNIENQVSKRIQSEAFEVREVHK